MRKILLILALLPLLVAGQTMTETITVTTPDITFTNSARGNAAAIGVDYIPSITQLEWTKLLPGMNILESSNMTFEADSIIIEKRGVYKIEVLATVEGYTQDDFGIRIYKNMTPFGQGLLRFTPIGASNYITTYYFWYIPCQLGDNISFWITNRNRSVGVKILDMKVLIERIRIPLSE